jgi:hypothetical protein
MPDKTDQLKLVSTRPLTFLLQLDGYYASGFCVDIPVHFTSFRVEFRTAGG